MNGRQAKILRGQTSKPGKDQYYIKNGAKPRIATDHSGKEVARVYPPGTIALDPHCSRARYRRAKQAHTTGVVKHWLPLAGAGGAK